MSALEKWKLILPQPVRHDPAKQIEVELNLALLKLASARREVKRQRTRIKRLEKAGDEMAKWFPFSSTHMKRVVGEWTEVRRVKL